MLEDPLVIVFTTIGDEPTAEHISRSAVQQGLAACVHIEPIRSVYRWNGDIQLDSEFRLAFKTTESHLAALQSLILELHPYKLPAVYAIPVSSSSEPYRTWVCESLKS